MNTPNPLHPEGTFPGSRGRSHIRIAVFTILVIHVVLLGALLLQGCKRTTETPPVQPETNAIVFPPFDPPTNPPSPVPLPPPPTTVYTPPPPPVPMPPVVPALPEGEKEHVVVKNDSFDKLAKQYNTTRKAIAAANPGVDSARLKIGQKLKIPAASATPAAAVPAPAVPAAPFAEGAEKSYKVKSGDTLTKIAKENGITAKALRSHNHLKTDQIKVGQSLKIPAKAAVAAVPALPEPVAAVPPPVSLPPLPISAPTAATNQ